MMNGDHFRFKTEELELLYRIQYTAVAKEQVSGPSTSKLRSLLTSKQSQNSFENQNLLLKKQWLSEWSQATESLLGVNRNRTDLKSDIQTAFNHWSNAKKSAFIVEVATFVPYFSLSDEKQSNKFSSIKFNPETLLSNAAELLETNVDELYQISKSYTKTIKAIHKETSSNNTLLILSAAAAVSLLVAPYLAAGIGGLMGLSGAAATSAGLAMLGGGSLATGGFGMAGGYVFTMGGGMLLSSGVNKITGHHKLANISGNELIISAGKLAGFLEHYKRALFQSEKEELLLSTCTALRELQASFEEKADTQFIMNESKSAKKTDEKAKLVAATRRVIRR
ncbi:hypothetical protein [Vibrio comitans]|uniref:Uncharacterized protein n=1 Tax=Vibrio comitans NBRC 102076 TaxID=1219078 RepID=A0A4Y3IJN0_9VIBR|nr:hypothetical protein [Vibrio comitans]GEA59148.1 hypothetical protein VCO01S_03410 [Vibrio comitans NBRC 102076]